MYVKSTYYKEKKTAIRKSTAYFSNVNKLKEEKLRQKSKVVNSKFFFLKSCFSFIMSALYKAYKTNDAYINTH